MNLRGTEQLSLYEDQHIINGRKHIMLVKNIRDNSYYVKKTLECYDVEVYRELAANPVEGMPRIHDIFLTADGLVIIEDHIKGFTILEHLSMNGIFSVNKTIDIIEQLCTILTRLHKHKPSIIHRDIKPSNIIITPEGRVVLLDFNAAKFENKDETKDTILIGTAGHAAPEQYGFASSTPQTDIYSIGVLMNIMLTGRLPSDGVANGRLNYVIKRCLELNPKDRYDSTSKLYKALRRIGAGYCRWLPPGFRSLKAHRIILSLILYLSVFLISYETARTYPTLLLQLLYFSIFFISTNIIVLFFGNYLDIQSLFPLMGSKNKFIRCIGFIISPILIWGTFIFFAALIEVFLIDRSVF